MAERMYIHKNIYWALFVIFSLNSHLHFINLEY